MNNQKNDVNCGVTDCAYYSEAKCTANRIEIGGKNATSADATCCETFRNSGNMVNSCGCSAKGGQTEIKCHAEECKHNSELKCMLDGIDVSCSCASCDCGSSDQTFCASFKL